MEDLMGLPVINIRYVPLTNTMSAIAKRCVDFAGSAVGLILISPLLLCGGDTGEDHQPRPGDLQAGTGWACTISPL